MIYLFLSVACSVIIANLLKFFEKYKNINIYYVFLGNYFLAFNLSYIIKDNTFQNIFYFDIFLGLILGFLFLTAFLLYQKSILINGITISSSILRFSLIIPTFLSLIIFKEKISLSSYIGIAIILIAFLIKSKNNSLIKNIKILIILFFVSGILDFLLKIENELGNYNEGNFLFIVFLSAFIFNLFYVMIFIKKFNIISLMAGLILGIPNQLSSFFFMKSLNFLPASIVYPSFAAIVIIFSFVSDIFIWRKKINKQDLFFILLLILGIIFINIR